MNGSVFVLLGCFAVFFAAPSHSYSIPEDDQLANREDTQSGSPSTDAATSGDAGESEAIKMDGDANPGDESVAGDAPAGKSKIRKRDTRRLYTDDMDTDMITPIDKEFALKVFRQLAKYGGECFERVFDHISHEIPPSFFDTWYPEALFTRSDLIEWLEITKDSVSECLMTSINKLNSESERHDYGTPDSVRSHSTPDTFVHLPDLFSPLIDIGNMLQKCLEIAIRSLEAASYTPGDTVQRSSESFSDLFTELKEILSLIDGTAVLAGDTVPMFPPGHTVAPYLDSVPVITTYKKRNFLDYPRGYRHYSNLPGSVHPRYVFSKVNPNSNAPQVSGFRGEAVQMLYTPGITAPPEDVNALATQQLSLLDIVLGKIYSKLQEKVSPAVNMEVAPVEDLTVDANGALGLYHGNGESPAMGNLKFEPECVHKMVQ